MTKKIVKKDHKNLLDNLVEVLKNRQTGFVTKIKVGEALFPYSLPPVIELVLLDPVENTIAFRGRSNPDGKLEKVGKWQLGPPAEVISFSENWLKSMVEVKAEDEEIVVEEKLKTGE